MLNASFNLVYRVYIVYTHFLHVLLCTGDRSAQTKLIRRGNIIECHQVKIYSFFKKLPLNLISIETFIMLGNNFCVISMPGTHISLPLC